jgi:hypothetical protein
MPTKSGATEKSRLLNCGNARQRCLIHDTKENQMIQIKNIALLLGKLPALQIQP